VENDIALVDQHVERGLCEIDCEEAEAVELLRPLEVAELDRAGIGVC
jgi:hypothetical protein